MPAAGVAVFYEDVDRDTAEVVAGACARAGPHICSSLGIGAPSDCRVYVMSSWAGFIFHSAPWEWRILLALTFPFWFTRVKRMWGYSAGWAQRYGRRRAVGVKPPRLVELTDRSVGAEIFVKEPDAARQVQNVTCHELTHAFTGHLRLPIWLNEGLAQLMVDEVYDTVTVRSDTLSMLEDPPVKPGPGNYRRLRAGDTKALAYHFVRSYWLTRYLRETSPGTLPGLLSSRKRARALEREVASACGMEAATFWLRVDGTLLSHFRR
jgi:hypothetical protein